MSADLQQSIVNALGKFQLVQFSDTDLQVNKQASPAMLRGFNNWFTDWMQQGNSVGKLKAGTQIFQHIFAAQQEAAKAKAEAAQTAGTEAKGKETPPSPLTTICTEVGELLQAQTFKAEQFNGASMTHMIQREVTGDANFFVTELSNRLSEHQLGFKEVASSTLGEQKKALLNILKTTADEVRTEVSEATINATDTDTKRSFAAKLEQKLTSPEAKAIFDQGTVGQILNEIQEEQPALELRTSLLKKPAGNLLNMSDTDLAENLHLVAHIDDSEQLGAVAKKLSTQGQLEIGALVDKYISAEESYQQAKQGADQPNIDQANAARESAYLDIIIHLNTGEKIENKQAYFKQELEKSRAIRDEKSKLDFGKIFRSITDGKNLNEFIANGVIGAVLGGLGMGNPILGVIAATVIGLFAKADSSQAATATNNSSREPRTPEPELASTTN